MYLNKIKNKIRNILILFVFDFKNISPKITTELFKPLFPVAHVFSYALLILNSAHMHKDKADIYKVFRLYVSGDVQLNWNDL